MPSSSLVEVGVEVAVKVGVKVGVEVGGWVGGESEDKAKLNSSCS